MAERMIARTQASAPGGAFEGVDPFRTFGDPRGRRPANFNPFWSRGVGENRPGAGLYGLPKAFAGWGAPARYSFAPTSHFSDEADPAIESLRGDVGRDFESELYAQSADIAEGQFSDARRRQEQGLAQAGYGGGGTVSPFQEQQLQLEGAARAGVLGNAARQSVMQAQAQRAEASRSYLNAVSQRLQAMLTPALLQSATATKQPVGQVGPNYIGPALQFGASAINALA